MLLGLAIVNGWNLVSIKLLLIVVFLFLVNPTATHAMIRAAVNSGEAFWKRETKQ
jgi:multicomponent Na+:H+ antiporter subunit G